MKRKERFKNRIHRQSRGKFDLSSFLNKINIFKYLSIFLIILFILSIPAVVKRLIKIDKIECNSQFGPCTKVYQLGDYEIQSYDYNFVKKHIEVDLNKDLQVNSYLIQYKIPSTIKIDLVLKKPQYAIKNLTNTCYLIDKEGVVLEISDRCDLPNLISNVNYSVGQKISDKDEFTLKLLEKIRIINNVRIAEIKNGVLEILIENGILVKFPLVGDIDVLTGSLRLIFSRLNEGSQGIRMEDVHEIDLRFKNPVLR